MKPVFTSKRIAAPPSICRAKFLDFPSLSIYKPILIRSITPLLNPAQNPIDLLPGDKLTVVLDDLTISATVSINTPTCFAWTGSIKGVIHGEHKFRFESIEGGTATELVQEEEFTGLMSWMLDDTWAGRLVRQREAVVRNYEGFNEDFKRWVEGGEGRGLA